MHAALADTPVVAIVGARQTGKSTLVQQAIANQKTPWVYRSLDDLDVLQQAQNDPNALLAGHPGPMAIDEIQRAPELLLAIKASVDRDRRPGRTAHILNLAEASRTSGIPASTLTRYLQILRNLFLVEEVPAWSTNATKRIARRPKILMSDTGLAAERLGMTAQRWRNQPHHEARGALMETFVGMELIKQASWSRTRVDINHYREHAGREVDFVLENRDGQVVGIEVKSAQRVGRDAVANLEHLRALVGDRFVRGIVLHTGDQTLAMSDRIVALPTHALWTLEA